MIKSNHHMNFENNQILTESLPSVDEVIYENIDPNYRKISLFIGGIFVSITLILYIIVGYFISILFEMPFLLLGIGTWFVLSAIILTFLYKSYEYKGFALRQKDIIFKTGMFFKSKMIIPFNRVQHCEINQGPIERNFGLSSLSLFTAGGSSSDLNIPGIKHERAERIKKFITGQVSIDEEE